MRCSNCNQELNSIGDSINYYCEYCENQTYSSSELKQLFKSIGKNVQIDKSVKIFGGQNISLGDNVRIDAFCILTGHNGIDIGNYVHIANYVQLQTAGGKIIMEDYTALASKTTLLTASDDFTEGYMNNPTMPMASRKVKTGDIILEKFCMTGVGCVILPGVTMHEGSAAGCMTLINKDVQPFDLIVGCPNKIIGKRNKDNLYLMEKYVIQHDT